MNILVVNDYEALSLVAATLIADEIAGIADAAIVVATGNTPVGAYEQLASLQEDGFIDASSIRLFQLDEYLGLKADDPRTLWGWMERAFVHKLGLSSENVVRLPTDTDDPAATCAAYDEAVRRAGGFDLAILGLGPNGHLAFNEPPAGVDSVTRALDLTEDSLDSNSVYWGGRENVPTRAMTAGLKQLLGARHILLLVSGEKKRDILQRVMHGPVTADVPASFLQLHPNVTVVADEAAVA